MSKKQTEKKESKDQLALQFIQSKYAHSGEVLYLVSAIQVGRISAYAAFDKNGISVYEFNTADNKSMFIVEQHEWRDFKKVIVDHYLVKSIFSFEGIKGLTLIVQMKGKELVDIIRRHTEIEVVILKRAAWRKVLGYRSQTNWKMLIASIVYTWLLLAILKAILPEAIHSAITVIGEIGFFLSVVALIVGLFKPKLVLPKVEIKTKKKVAYSYTYLIIVCFLAAGLFTKIEVDDTKTLKSAAPASIQTNLKEADQKAQEEADRKAQEEVAAQKAKEEAERKAQEEAAAKAEAEKKAQEEAAAKAEAEKKAQEEAALKAKQEEERKAQEVAAAQKAEAERKAQEQAAAQAAALQTAQQQASTSVYYKNCDAVRAAGAAPIHQGEPGYAKHLDRDGDGIACDR